MLTLHTSIFANLKILRGAGGAFFGDRLGYPAISMNFKTERFTYVMLLNTCFFTHFVINLTFNFLMIG